VFKVNRYPFKIHFHLINNPMAKQKMENPRMELWRNSKKEYNYRMRGKNGKPIEVPGEGYTQINGIIKNVLAIFGVGGQVVIPMRIKTGAIAVEFMFPNGSVVNMYWVDAPVTKKTKTKK
jgi:hypothetical protein